MPKKDSIIKEICFKTDSPKVTGAHCSSRPKLGLGLPTSYVYRISCGYPCNYCGFGRSVLSGRL